MQTVKIVSRSLNKLIKKILSPPKFPEARTKARGLNQNSRVIFRAAMFRGA